MPNRSVGRKATRSFCAVAAGRGGLPSFRLHPGKESGRQQSGHYVPWQTPPILNPSFRRFQQAMGHRPCLSRYLHNSLQRPSQSPYSAACTRLIGKSPVVSRHILESSASLCRRGCQRSFIGRMPSRSVQTNGHRPGFCACRLAGGSRACRAPRPDSRGRAGWKSSRKYQTKQLILVLRHDRTIGARADGKFVASAGLRGHRPFASRYLAQFLADVAS